MKTYDTAEMSDLDQYLTIARKVIASYAPKIKYGLAEDMLSNEDAVANVAHAIMMADWQFNGQGSRFGFRKDRAQFAIRNYVSRRAKEFKKRTLSFDSTIDATKSSSSFRDTMVSYYDSPIAKIENQELINKILEKIEDMTDKGTISSLALSYIKMHYVDGLSMQEIADQKHVSRQSVHDLINRSLKTIKGTLLSVA